MNSKKAKSLRKEYRKQVNDFMDKKGLLELFQLIVKPKPRWMPKWMWLKGIKIFINVQEDWNYGNEETPDKE